MAAGPQLLDRVDGRIEVPEHAEHARGRGRSEQVVQRLGERNHACAPFAATRRGGGSSSFTSAIDTDGKFFTNSRNHMKNQPKLPTMIPQSAQVALYPAVTYLANGSPARWTAMMTNRSIHIPRFTKNAMTNSAVMFVRTFLNQSSQGRNALQTFIVQPAHQNLPNARYQNASRSGLGPPYHATKYSMQYA